MIEACPRTRRSTRRSPLGNHLQKSFTMVSASAPISSAYERIYARAKIPRGQREKSFCSNPSRSSWLILVVRAIDWRLTPRFRRSRRRLGPNASRSDIYSCENLQKAFQMQHETDGEKLNIVTAACFVFRQPITVLSD